MLRYAFKEWAVICQALADGQQAIILRKGGIAESTGNFEVKHNQFWLFPTYVHQQRTGLQPKAMSLLHEVESHRPPAGMVRLTHFAHLGGIYRVRDLTRALLLGHLHLWSQETVKARFAYRGPGLYVLPVRVYRAAKAFELPLTPEYEGCRSWVQLDQELPTEGAQPVLSDADFHDVHRSLDLLLNPTTLV
jgi:hypothetical protein